MENCRIDQLLCGRDIACNKRENMIHKFATQMANYIYIVSDLKSKKACIIDPAWDVEGIINYASKKIGVEVTHALFTHRHFDHTGGTVPKSLIGTSQDIHIPGVIELLQKNISCFIGEKDTAAVTKQCGLNNNSKYKIHSLKDKDEIKVSNFINIKVFETPGHTPGSLCFKFDNALFTGDTLFIGSCGRIDLPESNTQDMLSSLNYLSTLPSTTIVYPGHNYAVEAHSTIGGEKQTNSMMMQAIYRSQNQQNAKSCGIATESVAALLPLPDYLGIARHLFKNSQQTVLKKFDISKSCIQYDGNDENILVVNPKQLESHF